MKPFSKYLFYTILPIFIIFGIGLLYKIIVCHFAHSSLDADLICSISYTDGVTLLCCYGVIKLASPILGFHSVLKRVSVAIGFYIFAYGLMALPYMLVSFFQPLLVNVFFHTTILIVLIELIFFNIQQFFAKKSATFKGVKPNI